MLALILMLVFGVITRFYQLDKESMWSDELFSASIASYFPLIPSKGTDWFRIIDWAHISEADTFWSAKAAELSPPLFELIAKISINLFGSSTLSMRIPSAVASITLLFWIALQVWEQRAKEVVYILVWVLLFTLLSAPYIHYSHEARPYSIGILFSTILSIKLFHRCSYEVDKMEMPKWGEIIIFVLACYTHYYLLILCAILLFGYGCMALLQKEWSAFFRLSIVPLVCLPWILLNAHTLLPGSQGVFAYMHSKSSFEAIGMASEIIGQITGYWTVVIALTLVSYLTFKLIFCKKIKKSKNEFIPLSIMILVFILYLIIISQLEKNSGLFHSRHFIFILPVVYIIIGIILSNFSRQPLLSAAIGVMIFGLQIPAILEVYKIKNQGYRDAAEWLAPKLSDGSIVITTWNPNRFYYRYYLDQSGKNFQQRSISSDTSAEAENICRDLKDNREFGVIAHGTHHAMIGALSKACGDNFVIEKNEPYSMIVQLWKNKRSK